MPVCSYLVIPESGAGEELAHRLAALPGCDVVRAENRDALLLVTDTPGPEEDRVLRETLEGLEGIQALVLSFGEVDPEAKEAGPPADRGKKRRRLPVTDPGGLAPSGAAARSSRAPGSVSNAAASPSNASSAIAAASSSNASSSASSSSASSSNALSSSAPIPPGRSSNR